MVELWIRPCKYVENKEKLFPLLLAKFSPPVADALEECQILAMELSLHSKDYYFDIEILQQRGVSEWYRFWNGDKKVMRRFREMSKEIPERYCSKHGSQRVYVVCHHLLTNIGGLWTRNSEPIGTILPPREGWAGFIICTNKVHEEPRHHEICEKCCLEQGLLTREQLGRAWHLTVDGLHPAGPASGT